MNPGVNNDVRKRLTLCFQAVFPEVPPSQFPAATTDTLEQWDSVAMVNLLTLAGEEFGVEIDWGAVDSLTSFAAL
jgi:acyl carrier protein